MDNPVVIFLFQILEKRQRQLLEFKQQLYLILQEMQDQIDKTKTLLKDLETEQERKLKMLARLTAS